MKHLFMLNWLLVALFAASCSAPNSSSRKSSAKFTTPFGTYGLVSRVKKPELVVCTQGVPVAETQGWETAIRSAIQSWIQPMHAWTGDKLTEKIKFVSWEIDCDVGVRVYQYVHSNTNVGASPTVNMAADGYFGSYNVLLHEFGHAYALGDTYINGTSGQCAAGQPQSVMCNTGFDTLQQDDIAGIKSLFVKAFPNDKPGVNGNTVTPENKGNIYLKIADQPIADGRYELFFSYDRKTGQKGGQMTYCTSDQATCDAKNLWMVADEKPDMNTTNNVNLEFFHIRQGYEITPETDRLITARYTVDGDRQYQAFKLAPR